MRVLLTSNLHYHRNWFQWLILKASHVDLVCVAGDILNLLSAVPIPDQIQDSTNFLMRLASVTPVAVCSGNHDELPAKSIHYLNAAHWLKELYVLPTFVDDGKSVVVEDKLILTTVPMTIREKARLLLLERGKNLRAAKELPWLILHHIPPIWHSVVDAEQLVIDFQPDYFFSGHFSHLLHGIERVRRVGKTILLNAGQKLDADFPSHFLLDTVTRRATWRSEDREESYQI